MAGQPRMMFGDIGGGNFGCKISKPGFSVLAALPGDILFDTSSVAFQKVLTGDTLIASGSVDPGTFNVTVPLPAEYAAFSNLQMWANYYRAYEGRPTDLTVANFASLKFGVRAGILYLSASLTAGIANVQLRSSWAIFNARIV